MLGFKNQALESERTEYLMRGEARLLRDTVKCCEQLLLHGGTLQRAERIHLVQLL